MKSSTTRSQNYRWLAGLLVGGAVVTILILKVVGNGTGTFALPLAEERATLDAPALNATREPPTGSGLVTSTESTTPAAESDPFPTSPSAQIDWAIRKRRPAMILFHSTNCKPCIVMAGLVDKVRADYEPTVVFVDVITNDRSNQELIQQAQIRAIPTSFFVASSGQAKGFMGAMTEEQLRTALEDLMFEE